MSLSLRAATTNNASARRTIQITATGNELKWPPSYEILPDGQDATIRSMSQQQQQQNDNFSILVSLGNYRSGSNEPASGTDGLDASAGDELFLADADIRSIMMDNDNLQKQLAGVILESSAAAEQTGGLRRRQADGDGKLNSLSAQNDGLELQLSLLAELVDNSIEEDYQAERNDGTSVGGADADFPQVIDNDHDSSPANQAEKINELQGASVLINDYGRLGPGQGRDDSRPRRALAGRKDNSDHSIRFSSIDRLCDDDKNISDLGGRRNEASNCSDIIDKCESGGQCLMDGQPARCRCPIGRGGFFCEKRK